MKPTRWPIPGGRPRLTVGEAAKDVPSPARRMRLGARLTPRGNGFRIHIATLAAAAARGTESKDAAGREAAELAQWVMKAANAGSVAPIAARFAASDGTLA